MQIRLFYLFMILFTLQFLTGCGGSKESNKVENPVIDSIKPAIKLYGNKTIILLQGTAYTEFGASANDNVDGNITSDIKTSGSVDTLVVGTYTITYTVTDVAGNKESLSRTVKVEKVPDSTKPSITLKGENPLTIMQGTAYIEPGASATDNIDGNLTVKILGKVTIGRVGRYGITYTAVDTTGNKASLTRIVVVKEAPDTVKPVITLNGADVILTVGDVYTEQGATATDAKDGVVSVSISGSVDSNIVGTYTVTYTASDVAGNTQTATRTVTVLTKITYILDQASAGTLTNVTYVNIHDSNRDNVPNMKQYYTTQLQKINISYVEEVRGGYSSKLFMSGTDVSAGSCTLKSLKANPNISSDGNNTIIEFGLGRNDRGSVSSYAELKTNIKTAIEAVQTAKPKAIILLVTPKEHPVDDDVQNASGKNDLRKAYDEISTELDLPLLDMKAVSDPSIVSQDKNDYYPSQASGARTDYYYIDGIHFNESGGRRVVNYIFSHIGGSSLFSKMLLEEFSNAGATYTHKTIVDINLGLSPMHLHL